MKDSINYREFLSRHDPIWEKLPANWFDAAFVGNGLIGCTCYRKEENQLILKLGRTDFEDERDTGNAWNDRPRLPIGWFTLKTKGAIRGGRMRLHLYDACLQVDIGTDAGTVCLRVYAHAEMPVMPVSLTVTEQEEASLEFVPLKAQSCCRTWAQNRIRERRMQGITEVDPGEQRWDDMWIQEGAYPDAPAPTEELRDGVYLHRQQLIHGSELTVAWASGKSGAVTTYYIACEFTRGGSSASRTEEIVRSALKADPAQLFASHTAWWHSHYQISFVSVPEAKWEGFYWLQIYKMASATRAHGVLMDINGPWLDEKTCWANAWFNLNEQLAYSSVNGSGRYDVGESMYNTFDKYADQLIKNMPEDMQADCAGFYTICTHDMRSPWQPQSVGDFPWAMYMYYEYVQTICDEKREREKVFPLMRRAMNPYFRMLHMGEDGYYHLEPTFSPEYSQTYVPDCTYNLAMIRMGMKACLEMCEKFSIDDPLIPRWKDVLAHLVPYPVDENGYMVGSDTPFAMSHRHYSHLVQIFPLFEQLPDTPEKRALMLRSVDHWQSMKKELRGYSATGAASLYSVLEVPEKAYESLNGFLFYVNHSTIYHEHPDGCQVIETPLSCARSIQDMLMVATKQQITLFPGTPEAWADACFRDLHAIGGYRVSAQRRDGRTQFVSVTSLKKDHVTLKVHFASAPEILGGTLQKAEGDCYTLSLIPGQTCVLREKGCPAEITPCQLPEESYHFFGTKILPGWEHYYETEHPHSTR